MARIKLGVTLQGSKGHSDRINGKPPQAYWGVSMSFHCTFSLDKCTLDVALKRLRIYELLNLLGLYPFLIDANHEVILSASCSFLRGSECFSYSRCALSDSCHLHLIPHVRFFTRD